ncbi:hypothetical protein O0555_04160 [Brevibacillus laterosporus]|uniref:hypothetical protein n=1 Tax=Brevibacillus laterosporus TaxID=1465 RepID=UPI000B9B25FB|nr:hypothetical protein [Brevibacillus laterosporus]MBG9773262.1 hypothetical protein [Brevibacillus laterosporus]MCR8936547.1 hypothetical protein [Brevibacillus laterosporus]MCZ0839186.1 hypothetical protein [Brevibacillus laterosporus]MCZ0846126.1 hypothetical protein [Brevibacillus laterosporus]
MGIAPCSEFGTHQMVAQGFANARDSETEDEIFFGGWFRCRCGDRFICQGNPHTGGDIAKYVTEGGIVKKGISVGGVTDFYVDGDLVYKKSSPRLDGYKFIKQ